ncbi:MAG: hypothetical protein V7785_14875 [Bermanella sp.]
MKGLGILILASTLIGCGQQPLKSQSSGFALQLEINETRLKARTLENSLAEIDMAEFGIRGY